MIGEVRRSDVDAVARAIDPYCWNAPGSNDEKSWMPQDIARIRDKRRTARAQARRAIATMEARGWHL